MEVVVTTGAVSRAKLQSNHHHQQTNTQFLQADASLVIQQCQRIFMNFRIDSFTPKFSKIYRLHSLQQSPWSPINDWDFCQCLLETRPALLTRFTDCC